MNKLYVSFLLVISFFPIAASAAEIFFDSNGNQFEQNEEFVISVQVDTKGQLLNAIEGIANFPSDIVEIVEIREGASVINFWIEEPNIYKIGSVRFSGITPGGLFGHKNILFSVVLRATDIGNGAIYASGLRSLLNDGAGTNIQVKNQSLPIIVTKNTPNSFQADISIEDNELPESFTPIITMDQDFFDGKYFLVFATQDKKTGIAKYKIREGEFGFYKEAKSPYLLSNQSLDQNIYVKAIDKARNERVTVLNARQQSPWYQQHVFFGILLLTFFVGFLIKKKWPRITN